MKNTNNLTTTTNQQSFINSNNIQQNFTTIKSMKIPNAFVSGATPFIENQRYLV